MDYLLYCALENEDIVKETILSIHTLFSFNSMIKPKVIICTDQKDKFDSFYESNNCWYYDKLIFEQIDKYELTQWKGKYNYIYRVKIKALIYIFQKYDGNILFVDSDVCILHDIQCIYDHISNNGVCLCSTEYITFDESIYLGKQYFYFKNFVRGNNLVLKNANHHYEIPLSFMHFNSGALGINSQLKSLLNDVLDLCDFICRYKLKFHNAEELAFSYVFQKHGNVRCCDEEIIHYCLAKEFRYIIDRYCGFNLWDKQILDNFLSEIGLSNLSLQKIQYQDMYFLYFYIRLFICGYRVSNYLENKSKIMLEIQHRGYHSYQRFLTDNKLKEDYFLMTKEKCK